MFALLHTWWFWMAMALILFLPLGYGWGYRGWGAPYPSYLQRQRIERAGMNGTLVRYDYQAWGWAGDFLWIVMVGDALLAVTLIWR